MSGRTPFSGGGRAIAIGGGAAIVGGALVGVGFTVDKQQALYSLLAAYAYVLAIVLGALIFNMICHAMNAKWPVPLRRLVEHVTSALPLLAVLFIPIALFAADIYEWVDPHAVPEGASAAQRHHAHLLHHKAPYLNYTFFLIRAVAYFAAWIALAELLRRWSLAQDRDGADNTGRMRAVGAAGLPIVGITMTFASFDWMMSLEPTWFSTAYGAYYFAIGFLGALCLIALLAHLTRRAGALGDGALGGSHFHALGRLMFAFTVFWAYIAYFQGFIIWIANKPEEVTWFVPRVAGSWGWVLVVLIVGHFAIPFFILLSRAIKFHSKAVAAIAVWQLIMGFIDVHWLVLPSLHPDALSPHWLDAAALLAVAGATVAFATWRARGVPLTAHGDPRFAIGTRYRSP